MKRDRLLTRALIIACVLALLAGVLGAAGCSSGGGASGKPVETTGTVDASSTVPPEAQVPPPPMLRDPETSIYSYLLWISFAYRVNNSDVATMAFGAYEEVRVNSYVQYNLQQGRAIDQRLQNLDLKTVTSGSTTATVASVESWKYRYISLQTGEYSSPWYDVTYDATYTVVNTKGKGWLVDKVEAKPRGEVK